MGRTCVGRQIGMLGAPIGNIGGLACYQTKVLSYNPIAYWMQAEAAGAVAIDEVNSPAQDGAYTGVTLGQPGIGEPCGTTCPFWDGANDYNNILTAALNAAWNGDQSTTVLWARVANAGVWTDGAERYALSIFTTADDFVRIIKSDVNNRLFFGYRAGGIFVSVNHDGVATTDWMTLGITVDRAGNAMMAYFNGVQTGLTQVGFGAWGGALRATFNNIGALRTTPASVFHGWEAHCALFGTTLSPAAMADLAVF